MTSATSMESVFAVPIGERWLVHAPLYHVTLLANRAAVARLARDALEELSLSLSNPDPAPRPPEGDLNPEFLGLVTTRSCNLACRYCGFGAAAAGLGSMDLSLAVAAVDWMASLVSERGRSTLDIHFFGGEPLSAPEVVDVAVHRARARAADLGLCPRFEIATNGVFDENRCQFLGDYFDTVVLSFDGPQEVHDRHRPGKATGSYHAVARTAALLARAPVHLSIRMCVTQETASDMASIARWFCETFQPDSIAFEPLQPTPLSERAGLRPPDPWDFAENCIRASWAASSAGVTPVYAAASIDVLRHSFCPVGRDTAIISPDGRVSACYLLAEEWIRRGMDLDLGTSNAVRGIDLDPEAVEAVRRLSAGHDRCRNCLARWHCAGGCHVNQSYPGCPGAYDDFCIQTRIITACRLLDRLGRREDVEGLLGDPRALERLALHASDRLDMWDEHD
ncbi:MAG: radical SAM protein [Planctomycetes bacterium]|nr:radical SAM protein [Planctomycetota bacterium]